MYKERARVRRLLISVRVSRAEWREAEDLAYALDVTTPQMIRDLIKEASAKSRQTVL